MKILLAEDERSLARALATILDHSGYDVAVAHDGPTALAHLLHDHCDAAILDIMMPGMDGLEVLRRARSQGIRTPIIMLTAKGAIEDKVAGLDAGANDYLAKPFSAKELMARIRAMTRAASAANSSTLVVGNITLDQMNCTLRGPAGEEHLPNREFQLLELFMQHDGTKIPTERLLLEVWGEDAPEDTGVVWVYVSYLRKKLAAVGANVHIKAARGQGYSLETANATDGARGKKA